jgi:hypothetical protein
MFLVPIILVAIISISHVVSWYELANPFTWAVYLSIAIEIGAMTALVAVTNRIKGGVWLMFGLVTFIQMVGNIFFSYKEVDTASYLFKSWIELTAPIWEALGSDSTDLVAMKRWIAFLEGGLLPIISLTSLHFFVKFDDGKPKIEQAVNDQITDSVTQSIEEDVEPMIHPEAIENGVYETSKIVNEHKEDEAKKVWNKVRELREEGKLPTPTQEDLEDEPTALAFTPYEVEEESPIVETFVSEDEYLDLQDSHSLVSEPVSEPVNEVVSEPVNEVVNESETEGITEGITEGVNEGVNEGVEPIIETTETINDDIREILEEIGDEVISQDETEEQVINVEEIISQDEPEENKVRRLSYVKKS